MWSRDQQHQHHLGTCDSESSTKDLLNQDFLFHNMSSDSSAYYSLKSTTPWKLEGQKVDVSELCVTNKLRKIHNDAPKATQLVGGRCKVAARFPDFRLRLFCTILVSCTLWQIPFSSQRTSSCLVSGTKPLSHVPASKSMTCGTSLEVQ